VKEAKEKQSVAELKTMMHELKESHNKQGRVLSKQDVAESQTMMYELKVELDAPLVPQNGFSCRVQNDDV
jgi:hypothetical protein